MAQRRIVEGLLVSSFVLAACGDRGSTIEQAMMAPDPKAAGAKKEEKKAEPKAPKRPAQTPEERRAALKALGIKPKEEIAAENAAMFEKGAREYVRRRLPEYRRLLDDLEKQVGDLEKAADRWRRANNPESAYARFSKRFEKWKKAFDKRYDELTGHGVEGGNTQAILGKTVRTFQRAAEVLGPKIGNNPEFEAMLAEVREGIAKVRKALDDIEKDPSLDAGGPTKPKKK